jgi:3-phenylpropionate/trans-cinnamate dioxygenase ferredoxin subunit
VEGNFSRVLSVSEVPPGTKRAVEVEGKSILVCNSNDRLFAVSNICSHAQEKLECGRMSRGWIACPAHGARFELATGRAMNPPAKQPIATFEVRVVDDWIEVLV